MTACQKAGEEDPGPWDDALLGFSAQGPASVWHGNTRFSLHGETLFAQNSEGQLG